MQTLKNNYEFTRVFRKGKRASTPHLSLYWLLKKNKMPLRLGIAVVRLQYNAVKRNRLKRLLREAARHSLLKDLYGLDCVMVVRGKYDKISYQTLRQDLDYLLKHKVFSSLPQAHPAREVFLQTFTKTKLINDTEQSAD